MWKKTVNSEFFFYFYLIKPLFPPKLFLCDREVFKLSIIWQYAFKVFFQKISVPSIFYTFCEEKNMLIYLKIKNRAFIASLPKVMALRSLQGCNTYCTKCCSLLLLLGRKEKLQCFHLHNELVLLDWAFLELQKY
jgi:hypothetical protein